jgi:transcriptional regulator with XRE-family HTH domain
MVGDEIRRARLRAGLSQESLAEKAGLHRTYISLLERNKKSPTIGTLINICQALGISAARIVKRAEDSSNESG